MVRFIAEARTPTRPFNATWIVDAPWAHPLWNQYAILLFDLTTPTTEKPYIFMPKATHEVQVWAIDPDQHIDRLDNTNLYGKLLRPVNHVYQFRAGSDELALSRCSILRHAIAMKQLNPDTDGRRQWDLLFRDGKPALRGMEVA
jgi:hypothetical protein